MLEFTSQTPTLHTRQPLRLLHRITEGAEGTQPRHPFPLPLPVCGYVRMHGRGVR